MAQTKRPAIVTSSSLADPLPPLSCLLVVYPSRSRPLFEPQLLRPTGVSDSVLSALPLQSSLLSAFLLVLLEPFQNLLSSVFRATAILAQTLTFIPRTASALFWPVCLHSDPTDDLPQRRQSDFLKHKHNFSYNTCLILIF